MGVMVKEETETSERSEPRAKRARRSKEQYAIAYQRWKAKKTPEELKAYYKRRNYLPASIKARKVYQEKRRSTSPRHRMVCLLRVRNGGTDRKASGLTVDYLLALYAKGCAITGRPFCLDRPPAGMSRHPYAPSIDQIVPKAGYHPDNVQLVCMYVNIAKNDMPHDVFVQMCRDVVRFQDSILT